MLQFRIATPDGQKGPGSNAPAELQAQLSLSQARVSDHDQYRLEHNSLSSENIYDKQSYALMVWNVLATALLRKTHKYKIR